MMRRFAKGWMMSSATSIERSDLPSKGGTRTTVAANADPGFRPWHFFVLASLGASTVAVILSRQSAPEHLILISLTIGAAGAAAAAVYRTIVPLTVRDTSTLGQRPSDRARAALEREKALVLRSIKELEFDRAMGKVSEKDFEEMGGRLRARAINLMKQLDAGGSAYREAIERELGERLRRTGSPDSSTRRTGRSSAAAEPSAEGGSFESSQLQPATDPGPRSCASCETVNDTDAMFCKRCGTALASGH
ncbi:MAG: hypothetical protein ACJ731_11305 [Vicinamibacterales bacterium]